MQRMNDRKVPGEGKSEFIVKTYAIVEIVSSPVRADNVLQAIQRSHAVINFDTLLRNLVGNQYVVGVEWDERHDKVAVFASVDGLELTQLSEIPGEELERTD